MSVSDPARQPPAWYEALDAVLDTDLPTTEKLLMVALIVRAGLKPDGMAYQSLKTLSRQISVGQETQDRNEREVRHVRRLLKNLETRKLVERNERSGRTTEYRIRWERLLRPGHQCPGSDPVSMSDPGHLCPPTPDADVLTGGTPVSSLPGHPCPPNIPLNLSHEPPPQPGTGGGGEWKEIGRQLREQGVRAWSDAICGARENDCQPADIQSVIDWFIPRRDSWKSPEAALHHRVCSATPDQRADDPEKWLPMKASAVRKKQTAEHASILHRLSAMPRDEIRAAIEWAVSQKMLRPLALKQFDADDEEFLRIIPNQTELDKVLAARDGSTAPPTPIAKPPTPVSSVPKHERTPHVTEASALRPSQSL